MIFHTSRTVWPIALITILTTLAAPVVVPLYFYNQLMDGAYIHWQGDVIAIPIFNYWLFHFPLSMVLLWRGLYKYGGLVPIYAWDAKRKLRSVGWTLAFLWTILADVGMIEQATNVPPLHPEIALFFVMHIYAMALLRAAAIGVSKQTGSIVQASGTDAHNGRPTSVT